MENVRAMSCQRRAGRPRDAQIESRSSNRERSISIICLIGILLDEAQCIARSSPHATFSCSLAAETTCHNRSGVKDESAPGLGDASQLISIYLTIRGITEFPMSPPRSPWHSRSQSMPCWLLSQSIVRPRRRLALTSQAVA